MRDYSTTHEKVLSRFVDGSQFQGSKNSQSSWLWCGWERNEGPEDVKVSEQRAIDYYNLGLRHRDKAWEYQRKASASNRDRDWENFEEPARRDFSKAVKRYRSAIEYLLQAYLAEGQIFKTQQF